MMRPIYQLAAHDPAQNMQTLLIIKYLTASLSIAARSTINQVSCMMHDAIEAARCTLRSRSRHPTALAAVLH
jgi:hypothetical protein